MARKAKTTLTPSGVKALKTPGFFGDSGAVGLYVQVQYRQKGKHTTGEKEGKPKLDRSHGIVRSWIFRSRARSQKRSGGWVSAHVTSYPSQKRETWLKQLAGW